jgi:hypothetical protein
MVATFKDFILKVLVGIWIMEFSYVNNLNNS